MKEVKLASLLFEIPPIRLLLQIMPSTPLLSGLAGDFFKVVKNNTLHYFWH
jgi:hypothetical protein